MLCLHFKSAFASMSTSLSKFNILSMVTQTQTHRKGLNLFSAFAFGAAIDKMLNFDGDATADDKCEQALRR